MNRVNIYLFIFFILMLPHSGINSPIQKMYQVIYVYIVLSGAAFSLMHYLNKTKYANLSIATNLIVSIIFASCVNGVLRFGTINIYDFMSVASVFYIPIYMVTTFRVTLDIKKVYYAIATLVVLNILDGLYQYFAGVDLLYSNPLAGSRLTGMFSWGAPVLGSFLGFYLFVVFYFFERKKNYLICSMAIFILMFILSGNRAVPLLALIGLAVGSFYSGMNKYFYMKMNIFLMIIASLAFSIYYVQITQLLGDHISSRILSLGGSIIEEQATKRIATWIQTYHMITDNLLLGVGFGNYSMVLHDYLYFSPISEGDMPHPHQFYLDFLASGGILTFVSLALYIFVIYREALKKMQNSKYKLINIMIFIIIFSPLNVSHSVISLWWGVTMFTGIGLMYLNVAEASESSTYKRSFRIMDNEKYSTKSIASIPERNLKL